jgi:predicted nucleic acid-binding protein
MVAKSRVFLDTNILVYQFDKSERVKRKRAMELINRVLLDGNGAISSQVVQEFANVALRKFSAPLSEKEMDAVMAELLEPLCDHFPTFDFYERSLRLCVANDMSLYDALIVQAALDLNCTTLYSEDFQNGRKFGDLVIVNPFA